MTKSNRKNSAGDVSHMLHRIEDGINSSAFDPQAALLNLLDRKEGDGVEDGNSSWWGDLASCSSNSDNDDDDIDNNSNRSDDLIALHHRKSTTQRKSSDNNSTKLIDNHRRKASLSSSSPQSQASFTTSLSQRQASAMSMMTHINHHHARSNPFTAAASDDGFLSPDQNRYWQLTTTTSRQRIVVATTALLLILLGYYNNSLGGMFQHQQQQQPQPQLDQYSTNKNVMITKNEQGGLFSFYTNNSVTNSYNNNDDNIPFVMCDRITPYQHSSHNIASDRSQYQHITKPYTFLSTNGQWTKSNKILLLRNDGKFGHIGNQFNSLLHAFDYARDHKLHIGILFHSWAMDVIHSMFYESIDFDILSANMETDFGILLVRNQSQLLLYDEVISQNAQQLYFYKSSNKNVDSWRDTMSMHKSILQQLFHRYNRGYGYVHNGLRAKDVCSTLDMFFKDRLSTIIYSVIHAQYMDGNTVWKLEQIAKTTGITIEGGAGTMSPAYVKSILKPLGMLEYPIILLTDGQLPGIERALLNDPIVGPRLMVLSDRVALDGADITLAVLSDVFIGNPASVTSGFIARIRMALGYSEFSTQLFRRKRIHQWYSVCNEDCVFNPWILSKWV